MLSKKTTSHVGRQRKPTSRRVRLRLLRVENLENRALMATLVDVTNTADSGAGSLRQAIQSANAATENVEIRFRIPTSDSGFIDIDRTLAGGDASRDVFRIRPLTPLPDLQNSHGHPIYLNAGTQRAFSGNTNPMGPEIELDGSLLSGGRALSLRSPMLTLRELSVHSFPGNAIDVSGDNVTIQDLYVGADATGKRAMPNLGWGIDAIGAEGLQVRGVNLRTLLAANALGGIRLSESHGSTIQNTFIGVDREGTSGLGNSAVGILVSDSDSLTIGGDRLLRQGNIISGQTTDGIAIHGGSQFLVISGNQIGSDISGNIAIPNGDAGLRVHLANQVQIGGDSANLKNVISGNLGNGISLHNGSSDIEIYNNYVGVNAEGNSSLPNGSVSKDSHGLIIGNVTRVKIGKPGAGNIISGNQGSFARGIGIGAASDVIILNNRIGTDVSGAYAIPNGHDGIFIEGATGVIIGGGNPSEGNTIAGNQENGIALHNATSVKILGNRIGIDILGQSAIGNIGDGITLVESHDVQVGGLGSGQGNVISGNGRYGIHTFGWSHNDLNNSLIDILGNAIGTTASGSVPLGNWDHGIELDRVENVTVQENLVSGNVGIGIHAKENRGVVEIHHNAIGVDRSGLFVIPNRTGISLQQSGGDVYFIHDNLISGNHETNVLLTGTPSSLSHVFENTIGLNISRSEKLGATSRGLHAYDVSNLLINNNLISGHSETQLLLQQAWQADIFLNQIGIDGSGNASIVGNGDGIGVLESNDVTISQNLVGGNANGITIRNDMLFSEPQEWSETVGGNGHWYWMTPMIGSYGFAEDLAVQLGTRLAAIESADENIFLTNLIQGNDAFIGLTDQIEEGTFRWSNGELPSFTNWDVNEPNGGTFENVTTLLHNGFWNDTRASNQHFAIFEFPNRPDVNAFQSLMAKVRVLSNFIGVANDGVTAISNIGHGIDVVSVPGVQIGGSIGLESANVIAFNEGDGIAVQGDSKQVSIRKNLIFGNQEEPIDLNDDGPTRNDTLDRDRGPNELTNSPVITAIRRGVGTITLFGSYSGKANAAYEIDLFANPSGINGPNAKEYLGSVQVTTNGTGRSTFSFVATLLPPHGTSFTGVTTDAEGNTSEVSQAKTLFSIAPPTAVVQIDSSGPSLQILVQANTTGYDHLRSTQLYVSIDGLPAKLAETKTAPAPDSSGDVSQVFTFPAYQDGRVHTYRFYSIGVDRSGNKEVIPLLPDQSLTKSFSAIGPTFVNHLDVAAGLSQRSYVTSIDLLLNDQSGLARILESLNDTTASNNRIRLVRRSLNGTGNPIAVDLAHRGTIVGNRLTFDFSDFLRDRRTSPSLWEGHYQLELDQNEDGIMDQSLYFFRLYGDVNGDGVVNQADLLMVTAASTLPYSPEMDVNGNGVVDRTDISVVRARQGRAVGSGLPNSDP